MKMKIPFALAAAGLAALAARAQHVTQTITLANGWNAVYLEVTPDDPSPEAFMAAFPTVERIGCYLQDGDEQLRQVPDDGVARAGADLSFYVATRGGPKSGQTLGSLIGGSCYLIYTTGAARGAVRGVPALPRMRWRDTSDPDVLAPIVGVSALEGVQVAASKYFGEGPFGGTLYTIAGTDPSAPAFLPILAQRKPQVAGGMAYGVSSTQASDWPGVIDVGGLSLGDMLVFGAASGEESFTVRNAGTKERTLRVELVNSADPAEKAPPLLFFDSAATNGNYWVPFTSKDVKLEADATRTVYLAVDHAQIQGPATNAAVIAVSDLDGGTQMRVRFPVVAVTPGGGEGSGSNSAWPNGVWIGRVVLDKVSFGTNGVPLAAGGAVNATVLMRIKNQKPSLLQRIVVSNAVGAEGKPELKLSFDHPGGTGEVRRVSCVLMDPAQPEISCASFETNKTATFSFTIGEGSPVNPFRHTWHPDHDGLTASGDALAPSGDVPANYARPLKPELWSVSNTVEFVLNSACTNETPEAVTGGTVKWTLNGLRAKTPIVCSGGFVLQRMCANTEIEGATE